MYLAYFFDDLPLAERLASVYHPLEFGPVPWLASRFFFGFDKLWIGGSLAIDGGTRARSRNKKVRKNLLLAAMSSVIHMMLLLRLNISHSLVIIN
jgi:hypothetical protein